VSVIALCDVGPRDGLQNEPEVLAPSVRAQLCERLADAGLVRIEAASFVNPTRVPQMGGAEALVEELAEALPGREGVAISALVLNERGLQRALAGGVAEIHFAYPLTDSFCERNQGMTVEQAASTGVRIIDAAHRAGARLAVTFSVAFGCPFEGTVDPGVVVEHAARMAGAGADELMLADTIGVAVPAQVRRLVPAVLRSVAGVPVGLHLHNTRNTGYVNALVGLEHGASLLDASIGGLGGCPFAPRATGNIATEDLAYMLDSEGIESGVSVPALIEVSEWLSSVLGRELPGLLYKAGLNVLARRAA
jgi:isopropylmalate/homocitrate/citramalate synthase